MFILLKHDLEISKQENYSTYTEQEIVKLVVTAAKELGINDLPKIDFFDDEPEQPLGAYYNQKILFDRLEILFFNRTLLNGEKYRKDEILEVIKHELTHLIAHRRYNEDCGHDERWQEIAKEVGCIASEVLNKNEYYDFFKYKVIENNSRDKNYYIYCNKCGKLHLETNSYQAFKLFIFSCTNFPLTVSLGELKSNSSCCNTNYKLEASVENLLKDLVDNKEGSVLQERLKNLLENV